MKFYTFGDRENPAILLLPGTQVHVFYAVKMGEMYEERYRQRFRHPNIRRHDLQHEELLVRYPSAGRRKSDGAAI